MPAEKISQEEQRAKQAIKDREKYQRNREKVLARVKRYREANRAKITEQRHRYKEQNPERVRHSKRRDYDKHRDSYIARAKAHHAANLDHHAELMRKWYRANTEKVKQATRQWAEANPEKARASRITRVQRRRLRIASVPGKYKPSDIHELLSRQGGRCAACHIKIEKTYSVDHIMPIVLGGTNDPSNIQLLCMPCNLSKGKMHPSEWAARLGKLFV